MQKYQNNVISSTGRPVSSVSISVTKSIGGVAVIYSDNSGTPLANPFTSDSLGNFAFYAADGRYNITISGAGITTTTISDVLLEDPANGSSAVITGGTINATAIGETTPSTGAFTTLSVSGAISTGSGGDTNAGLQIVNGSAGVGSGYGGIYAQNVTPSPSNWSFYTTQNAASSGINGSTNSILYVANSAVATASSTGLSVTGALSATGGITSSSNGFSTQGTGNGYFLTRRDTNAYAGGIYSTAGEIRLDNASGTVWTADTAGNLGLGVTPSAWIGNRRVMAVGGHIVANINYAAPIGETAYNFYYTSGGTPIYQTNGPAAIVDFNNTTVEGFSWRVAPSGTAGAPISFTPAMTLDSSGNLLLNDTNTWFSDTNSVVVRSNLGQAYFKHLTGTGSGTYYSVFSYAGAAIGSITQSGTTAVSYSTTSDHRLKTNVRPANAARFMDIQFRDFEWTDGRHDCGVIAHELQEVYPDLVLGEKNAVEVRTVEITPAVPAVLDEEGKEVTPAVQAVTEEQAFPVYQQVNYIGLIGRMGTRVQDLQRAVWAQAELIEAMEARLSALEATGGSQ